jgi:hypothetical protein
VTGRADFATRDMGTATGTEVSVGESPRGDALAEFEGISTTGCPTTTAVVPVARTPAPSGQGRGRPLIARCGSDAGSWPQADANDRFPWPSVCLRNLGLCHAVGLGRRGVHVAESTRIAGSRLDWPQRMARARRDGRGGSRASGRPCDVGPRCERWRALDGERDAAFDPPVCLSRVLTPPGGETRRRISSGGGVAVVVSRDARLRS